MADTVLVTLGLLCLAAFGTLILAVSVFGWRG